MSPEVRKLASISTNLRKYSPPFALGLVLSFSSLLAFFWLHQFILFIVLHLAATGAAFFAIARVSAKVPRRSPWQSTLFFGGTIFAFFPGLGWLMAIVFYVAVLIFERSFKANLYDEYQQYMEEKREDSSAIRKEAHSLREIRREIGFEPFVDIISGSNVQLKARVIGKLARKATLENIQLLKIATTDPSADVRLYAASALIKIENELNRQIQRALKYVKQEGSQRAYFDLAQLYWSYARSGLLDPTLSRYYLDLCAQAYQQSLDIDTNQPRTIANYITCLLALQQPERAMRMIESVSALWPENIELAFLKSEVYFQLGRMSEISPTFDKIDVNHLSMNERDVFQFWRDEVPFAST